VLGSLVYAGIVLVGFFIAKLFLLYNVKLILVSGYIGMVASLFLFTITYPYKWPYFLSRFFTGMA